MPGGHKTWSTSQMFLAISAFVGWVSLATYLNMKLMKFSWLDWSCGLQCERMVGAAAFLSRRRQVQFTAPQTKEGWWADVFLWNFLSTRQGGLQARAAAAVKASADTYCRSWRGYRWPTTPSVQHHQRRGSAKHILPLDSPNKWHHIHMQSPH